MKAVVCTRWGPPEVLRIAEVERPAPRKGPRRGHRYVEEGQKRGTVIVTVGHS